MNNELQFLIYDTPEEGELEQKVVISILETTTEHGAISGKTQTNLTKFYNLDAIISMGYRSIRAREQAKKLLQKGGKDE